jgi:hypothetical protein
VKMSGANITRTKRFAPDTRGSLGKVRLEYGNERTAEVARREFP